ncbi:sigma-54-dependent Fis family transcriptional regulator [Peribacillus cavernae]|uniref:Sigma-54-dependent Fis family transcriptional regulator n=1 Tax=Peribacillus cavernae TaxID=1674310 RepID=A0A433HJM6_9BACI|nr:sigma-54 dependent transcriptional regulator [Peribacillus cavernae]MDQ0219228.1 two-component system response regulator AtoC [Peribacillus cavernae]RUQ28558.1 sigma-54-dependent Fis family transcriptional regulator [Peribacillus cavernae]
MKPHILVIDDEQAICASLSFALEDDYRITTTTDPAKGLRIIEDNGIDIALLDLSLGGSNGLDVLQEIKQKTPSVTVIMMTAYASIETSIEAIKKGAYYYIEKPINMEELHLLMMRAAEFKQMSFQLETLHEELEQRRGYENFLGKSKAMQVVFSMIERIKSIDSSVLITGESGTGKELVARSIHNTGKRKGGPLETVNCAAIPETLLESELFGYEKGAFTGATQRKEGRWAAANGGTLFLDEISEMPLALQVKLLRALQEREITPLGSNIKIPLDVRIVSAANKNLEQMVMEGTFREDLYFRLNVIPLSIPPLRERKEDLPLLIDHFLQKYSKEMNRERKSFSSTARGLLLDYSYPGNVRELGNIIEYSVALSQDDVMTDVDLPPNVQQQKPAFSASITKDEGSLQIPIGIPMKEIEKKVIAATLNHCGRHKRKTALTLQISERSLRDKIKLYQL